MATIPASVKAQLDADWTGAGGAEPPYYVAEDYRTNPPLGGDSIWILDNTDTDPQPVNDLFVNEFHKIDVVVTATTADRLKEIGDEVIRILNATRILDMTYQRYGGRRNTSNVDTNGVFINQEVITYDMREHMKSSAAAYGSGATGVFTTIGDLKVGGDDIQDSSGGVVISFDGAGNIDVIGFALSSTLDLKVSGDTDDYFEFSTVGDAPTIKGIGGSVTLDSDGATHIKQQGNVAISIGTTIFIQKEFKMQSTIDITTQANKVSDIGATGLAFDNIYADDFVNESPFKQFQNPLALIKTISAKAENLDYSTLPDWLRATKRIGQVIETDKDGNITVIEEGEKVVTDKGFSVNRMCILLYQALQEATTRIEALEAR